MNEELLQKVKDLGFKSYDDFLIRYWSIIPDDKKEVLKLCGVKAEE